MTKSIYEAIGRYIYGAYRNGGTGTDVENWMADDLGVARPTPGDGNAQSALYAAFFAKYTDMEALQVNHARFMESLNSRAL